jgi:hypothetical protein
VTPEIDVNFSHRRVIDVYDGTDRRPESDEDMSSNRSDRAGQDEHGRAFRHRTAAALRDGRAMAGGAVLLTVLAGCGSTSGSGSAAPSSLAGTANPVGGDTTSPATIAATTMTSASATATAPAGSAPTVAQGSSTPQNSGAASSTRCHTSELKASVGANNPGAGQENVPIVLTNRSGRTCTVYGFPGAEFVNSKGQAVAPDPERASGSERKVISLAPGKSAWAGLSFGNPAITGATTTTPAALLITPPDETAALKVPWTGGPVSNTGKTSVPSLGAFAAGNGG